MAAGASPPVAEAVQFLMDPGVRQTPKEMQLGYLRDVLKLDEDRIAAIMESGATGAVTKVAAE